MSNEATAKKDCKRKFIVGTSLQNYLVEVRSLDYQQTVNRSLLSRQLPIHLVVLIKTLSK